MPTVALCDTTPMYYELAGWSNEGPPIVFLNGMSQSTAHWGSHVAYYRKSYRVVTFDARGQGGSPTGEVEITLKQHADDLVVLLDELEVEKVIPVGFSYGGRMALALAAYYPSRISKLVLVSSTTHMTPRADAILTSWLEVLLLGGLEAMSWAALPVSLGKDYIAANHRMLRGIVKASVQRNSVQGLAKLLRAMKTFPSLGALAEGVVTETLVISADEDPLVEVEDARALAEQLHGNHALVTKCGHTIPIEQPQRFRELIDDFLGSGL